jgi:hypothetical protein
MAKVHRLSKHVWVCALVALILVLAPVGLQAQRQTATVTGTATDSSGGALAGASVQATNAGTGISQSTSTDAQGRYTIPQLDPGTYNVQASLAGFKTVVHAAVVLSVGGTVVVDFSLPVGEISQTVSVEGQVSRVETENAQVSTLVSPTQMRDLPLNGRNFEQLITLAPGVATIAPAFNAVTGRMYGMMDNYSIAGSRPTGQMFLLDSTDIRDFWEHGTGSGYAGTSLGVEAIGEFQTITNSYTAQFSGNGVVNATSRSGTNDIHGTAYEFFRNSVLDALDSPDKVAGLTSPPPFRRNQFGGDLGGPIKKDKLFFFGNYEGLREAQEQTALLFAPEPYVAAGMLPCYSPNPTPGQSPARLNHNPSCPAAPGPGTALPVGNPGNPVLAVATAKAQAVQDAALYSLCKGCKPAFPSGIPCGASPAVGSDCGGFTQIATSPNLVINEDYVLGRVDYTLGSNDALFGRYVFDDARVGDGPREPLGIFPESDFTRNQFLTIGERHVFSATLVNSVHFGYVRTNENSSAQHFLTGAQVTAANAFSTAQGGPGVPGDPLTVVPTSPGELPRQDGQILGFGVATADLGPDPNRPLTIIQNKFSGGDDIVWTHGAHSLKVGGVVTRVQTNTFQTAYANGSVYFPTTAPNAIENSLSGVYSFAFAVTAGANNATRYLREILVQPYIQDDWKVTPSLTLNIGIRYDYDTNPVGWAAFGKPLTTLIGSYLPPRGPVGDTSSPYAPFTAVRHVFQNNINAQNWGPRFGFAWDIFKDHKTSLRGGAGLFYDPTAPRLYQSNFINTPPSGFSFVIPAPFPNPCPGGACPVGATGEFAGVDYIAPRGSPYQLQYNLGIQRELWHNTVLSVGYVGSASRHLWTQGDINPPKCTDYGKGGANTNCTALPLIPTSYPTAGTPGFTVNNNTGSVAANSCVAATQATCYGSGTQFPFIYLSFINLELQGPRINPAFGSLVQAHNTGSSAYNSLQVSLNHQFARNFTGNVNYTWSRCVDNGSFASSLEEWAQLVTDRYNERYDYGNCNFDLRHNFSANGLYSLPFKGNRFVEGWQFGTVLGIHTGLPLNIYNGGIDPADLGTQWGSRANYSFAAGCNPNHLLKQKVGPGTVQWFDPTCYEPQAPGFLGNIKRNSVSGPGTVGADISITKNTKVTEKLDVQFRAEMFNFINHLNPGAANPFSGFVLGAINQPGGGDGRTQYSQSPTVTPRQIQFALKLQF